MPRKRPHPVMQAMATWHKRTAKHTEKRPFRNRRQRIQKLQTAINQRAERHSQPQEHAGCQTKRLQSERKKTLKPRTSTTTKRETITANKSPTRIKRPVFYH